jgi:hypothetical protein
MSLYIYADETEFGLKDGISSIKVIGSGLLVTNSPVTDTVVTEALKNLQNDPDIKKQDKRTPKRGYFHASKDTEKSLSHFCCTIKKYVKGNFVYSYFKPSKEKPWKQGRTLNALRKLTLGLSSVSAIRTTQEIIFIIERRPDFDNAHANIWIEELYKKLEYSVYDIPAVPIIFPHIKLGVGDKRTPGLQVTDCILWSMNRSKRIPPDNIWIKRLNLKLSSTSNEVNGPREWGSYILGDEIESPSSYPNYALPVKDPTDNEELIQTYILIERSLRYVSTRPFPPHAKHLKDELVNTVGQLSKKDTTFSTQLIQEASSIFIRLFDTLPIYDGLTEDNNDKWSQLLTAKKMASLFLRKDLIHGVRSCDYITNWRRKIIKENPQVLDIEN